MHVATGPHPVRWVFNTSSTVPILSVLAKDGGTPSRYSWSDFFRKKGTQKKWLSNTKFVDFGGFFFRARKCETRSHHYQVDIKFGDFLKKTDLVAKNHSQCHRGLSGRLKASRNLTFVCLKQCILVVFTSTGRPGWWYHKLSHPWFCTIKNPWNMLKLWIASPIFWGKAEEIASRWAPSGSL